MNSISRNILSACVAALLGFSVPGAALAKAPSRSVVTRAPLATGTTLRYELYRTYAYQWDAYVRSTTHSTGETGDTALDTAHEVHATVGIRAVEARTDGSFLLEVALHDTSIGYLGENGYVLQRAGDQDKYFLIPMYFEQQADGTITRVLISPDEPKESLNMKRGVASALQAWLGANTEVKSETDVTGTYAPRYAFTDDGRQLTITRSRSQDSYERFADPEANGRDFGLTSSSSAVFDRGQSLLTSITARESFASAPDHTFDTGYTVWTTVDSSGSLSLLGPDTLPFSRATPDLSSYKDSSLVAEISHEAAKGALTRTGEAQLGAALLQLQQAPQEPARMHTLVKTLRTTPGSVKWVETKLRAGAIRPESRGSVLNALAAIGTPEAQSILLQQVGQSGTEQTDAMVALMLVARPSLETVDALEQLSAGRASPLQQSATLVLGAAADRLQLREPLRAAVISQRLTQGLHAALPAARPVYLGALGNAGSTVAVETLSPYLHDEDAGIRLAAVQALRKHSAAEVNGLLHAAQLDRESSVRDAARDAEQQVNGFTPMSGPAASWGWGQMFGTRKFGAELNASLYADGSSSIMAKGDGEAAAWFLNSRISVVKAALTSNMVANSTTQRLFTGNVFVFGYLFNIFAETVTCGATKTGNLYNNNVEFTTVSYSIPLFFGISIDLNLAGSANVSVPYTLSWSLCNAPVNADGKATITPTAWVTVSGDVGLNLLIASAGVGVDADLLKSSVPGSAEAKWASSSFQACLKLDATLDPASGSVYGWAKLIFTPKAKFLNTKFSYPGKTLHLVDKCF